MKKLAYYFLDKNGQIPGRCGENEGRNPPQENGPVTQNILIDEVSPSLTGRIHVLKEHLLFPNEHTTRSFLMHHGFFQPIEANAPGRGSSVDART